MVFVLRYVHSDELEPPNDQHPQKHTKRRSSSYCYRLRTWYLLSYRIVTMNAFTIPAKSIMHGVKNNKSREPNARQYITLEPRRSDTERMLRQVFGGKYKPAQVREVASA